MKISEEKETLRENQCFGCQSIIHGGNIHTFFQSLLTWQSQVLTFHSSAVGRHSTRKSIKKQRLLFTLIPFDKSPSRTSNRNRGPQPNYASFSVTELISFPKVTKLMLCLKVSFLQSGPSGVNLLPIYLTNSLTH